MGLFLQKAFGLIVAAVLCLAVFPFTVKAQYGLQPKDTTKFEFTFEKAKSVNSTFIVKNSSTKDITLVLYAADGTKTDLGTITLKQPHNRQKGIGAWTKLQQEIVTLTKGEQREISFSITAPSNVFPGTYVGGIAASTVEPDTSTRVILPIVVNIAGERIVDYSWNTFDYQQNTDQFVLELQNKGNTLVAVDGDIVIKGFPFVKEQHLRLLHITLLQDELIKIPIKAENSFIGGFFTATANLTFTGTDLVSGSIETSNSQIRSIGYTIIPWGYLYFITALVALILLVWYIRKQQWEKYINGCLEYQVGKNETLAAIAMKHRITWKKLAKINKLNPPFQVKSGQILFVPPHASTSLNSRKSNSKISKK